LIRYQQQEESSFSRFSSPWATSWFRCKKSRTFSSSNTSTRGFWAQLES